MEIIGWAGGMLLAFCGMPLAWQSYKQKHSDGVSVPFLTMWMIGEILLFIYVLPMANLPLLLNYGANIICIAVVIRYKFK